MIILKDAHALLKKKKKNKYNDFWKVNQIVFIGIHHHLDL